MRPAGGRERRLLSILALLGALGCAAGETPGSGGSAPPDAVRRASELVDQSIERTLSFYPSRALSAGRQEAALRLESYSDQAVAEWIGWNRELVEQGTLLVAELAGRGGEGDAFDARADLSLAIAEARIQLFELTEQRVHETDPLLWSGTIANALPFLLIRDEMPMTARLDAIAARIAEVPRLVGEAGEALGRADRADLSPDLLAIAVGQLGSVAEFYGGDLARFVDGPAAEELGGQEGFAARREAILATAADAAEQVRQLATLLEERRETARGSFRLADRYERRFRLVTGETRPVAEVLAAAEEDLAKRRGETALFARRIWDEHLSGEMPFGDREVIQGLFDRIAEDRAATVEEFVEDYRTLVLEAEAFVRERGIVGLPDPLTLVVDRSPAVFTSQAFGGVYSSGPWAPEADTLLLLPTPPADADDEQLAAFFRDFNHHFNTMIIAHELMPGHYLQLKVAARSEHPARYLYSDPVFVEGWGTFSERLMLEQGWGDDLAYAAHLKKQLENIARTIVDIRVHTENMTREEVERFVTEEAMQDVQFARNMWRRAMTTSPQLTFYWLGDTTIAGLQRDARAAWGDDFSVRRFTDAMMEVGPVTLPDVRTALGLALEAATSTTQ